MDIPANSLDNAERYALLTSAVVPRPIAWITSADEVGVLNAAPFSYFNVFDSSPPILGIGVGKRREGEDKDTLANIRAVGEFVVHIVNEALTETMVKTAIPFPAGEGEVAALDLATCPSSHVGVPRLKDAPVALECRTHQIVPLGSSTLVLGEVVSFYVQDGLIQEGKIDPRKLCAVGRLGGSFYTRTQDLFEDDRKSYEAWKAGKETG